MPDAVTHAIVAMSVQDQNKHHLLETNLNYFILGAQGADPYFYYNFLPWKDSKPGYTIGELIHHKKTKLFLDTLLRNATEKESQAFVCGMLTHFAVDTTCHPFIFYFSGLYNPTTKENRGTHLAYERAIDYIYLSELTKNPRWFNVQKAFFPLDTLHNSVIQTLNGSIESVYNIKEGGDLYRQGYKDFKKSFQLITYDPLGFKKDVLKLVDLFTTSSQRFANVSHYKIVKRGIDYLNRKQKPWHHPVTNEEYHTSFVDLMKDATTKANTLVNAAIDYFENGETQIFSMTENLSYDTGLEIGHDEMKYFNVII